MTKLIEVLPNLQSFKDNVISPLINMFNGAEWLNDATTYTKQETIYKLLILKYGDRYIRYDDNTIFLNRLVFDLADLLPDIYAKQQVFIKNKLGEYLSDNKNRAIIIESDITNTRDSNSNSKLGNSSSPLNLVINTADEILNAPVTSANISNVKLLENFKGANQQVNYNFVNDLIKTLDADYSLRINEFMSMLGSHFISIVGSYYKTQNCNQTIKHKLYMFKNGYEVNNVNYLCSENQQAINSFNAKLENLNNQVATKQNQLIAGKNITIDNNVISATGNAEVDLSNYYNKQQINEQQQLQDNYINQNKQDIKDIYRELVSINGVNTELNDKVNVNTVNIETNYQKFNNYYDKQQIDSKLKSIIRFYKGQVLTFASKAEFEENIKRPLGLTENVDYEVYGENNRYLMIGENADIGGNNIISENNIQLFRKDIVKNNVSTYTSRFNTDSIQGFCSRGAGNTTNFTNFSNVINQSITIGNVTPQEFLPKFKQIYCIKLLKNI